MTMTTKRRFSATAETVKRDLKKVVERMGATTLRVNQDILNGEVEIIFDRGGRRYVFRCERYNTSLDNMRAAQLAITYLWRALEEYGVSSSDDEIERTFSQFFIGFEATPDDSVLLLTDSNRQWWEVLGVEQGADKQAIINAYRALAKIHHPDTGGNPDDFRRLREAYETGLEVIK